MSGCHVLWAASRLGKGRDSWRACSPTSLGSGCPPLRASLTRLPGRGEVCGSGPLSPWESSGVGTAVGVALTSEQWGCGYPGLYKGLCGCGWLCSGEGRQMCDSVQLCVVSVSVYLPG